MTVESKEVIAYHSSAVALRDWITKLMEQPTENRIFVLKPGELVGSLYKMCSLF